MSMPDPKFAPGEPIIIRPSKIDNEFYLFPADAALEGARGIVIDRWFMEYPEDGSSGWCYQTIPPSPFDSDGDETLWPEEALEPLPPEEFAGCFDAETMPKKEEIEA